MKQNVYLKIRRQALDLTQGDVAKLAGVSKSTVSNLENGMELSEENYIKIKESLHNYQIKLSSEDYLKVQLKREIMALDFCDSDEERLSQLSHMIVHIGKYQRRLLEKKLKD